jgi:hypothetical protein
MISFLMLLFTYRTSTNDDLIIESVIIRFAAEGELFDAWICSQSVDDTSKTFQGDIE